MTTELPAGWLVRGPTLDDVPEILAVVHASDIVAVGEPDFTTEEVVEILGAPNHDPQRDSWVALDGSGRIVGWAFIYNPSRGQRDNFDAYVHPEYGRQAQPRLLKLVLGRIAERASEFGYPYLTARSGVIATEESYVALLRSAGFEFVKRSARMRRDLAADQPAPQVPEGVTIRPVRHDDDAEMRAFHRVLDATFRDTPDYQPASYDTYRQQLAVLPGIDWDEWFVAEVDGDVVAILQSAGQIEDENEGWVKNLGVSKEFRGRGLGRLLLQTAFHTYATRGRLSAGLGVDMTNPTGAYRLYESVGLSPLYESDVYERRVIAATQLS